MDSAGPTNATGNVSAPIAQDFTNVPYVMGNMPVLCAPSPQSKDILVSPASILRENKIKVPLILPTPVKAQVLDRYLDGYNQEDRRFIYKGFSEGFALGVVGSVPASISPNHSSALTHPDFIDRKLQKELGLNRIKGPYKSAPFKNFKVSPLGVVPKREPNSFRLIQDLSFGPQGSAVNHFIPAENATVTLETFDDVAKLVLNSGRNSLISKADIEEAYRIVPLSPLDYPRLGFAWKGQFYFERVLVMGASSSVRIFETISKSIQWVLQSKLGVKYVSHIIDDFIFIGKSGTSECADALQKFFNLCNEVGIPIKQQKTIFPTTCAPIHGIELDTVKLEARLPQDKLSELLQLLKSNMHRKKIRFRDLQSLLGHLNFACKVIKPGRCFLRRLYDLTCGTHKPDHLIRLNKAARADLKVWASFLDQYNGCTIITDDIFVSSNSLQLHTDAARSKGFACIFQEFWTWGAFSASVKQFHINILELYPITLAVYLFGSQWQNKNILFICDNLSIVHCLNNQTSKDKTIMRMLRIIVLQSLKFNFRFASKHISSKSNIICDKLSRFQISEAKALAKHLKEEPEQIPPEVSPDSMLL